MAKTRKPEVMRRLRLGDLRRYCRHRYGPVLPDDDAGRETLTDLLLPISLGPTPAKIMANVIEVTAPWMNADAAQKLVDEIMQMPEGERRPNAKVLGKRLNVTNAERERLRLWTMRPADMTDAQMAAWRKAKERARKQRKRQQAGAASRKAWLAASLTKQKPWKIEAICRRTWERRRQKPPVAGPSATRLSTTAEQPATLRPAARPKARALQ
jgi:hypothetical protein